ncbi:MAG: hypothetical protein IJ495_00355 [Bacteroidales bacterium]|nr:hypothetical protein [Bacteroidales bacterium]
MSRKSIILCLVALVVMVVGIGAAVFVLYSDVEMPFGEPGPRVPDDRRHTLLSAVPSDAAVVACFHDARDAAPRLVGDLEMPDGMRRVPMAVSLHYSGKFLPLYVFECQDDETLDSALSDCLSAKGMTVRRTGDLLVASVSETLVNSSARHLDKGISILDASGFEEALSMLTGNDAVFVSNTYAGRLLPALMKNASRRYSDFFVRFSDWMAFDIKGSDRAMSLDGKAVYDGDATDFMTVLGQSVPSSSSLSSILPSGTLFALTLPMKDFEPYVTAYQSYLDTRQKLQSNVTQRDKLADAYGKTPQTLMYELGISEIAVADVMKGGKRERINLLRVGNDVLQIDDDIAYAKVASSLFGDFFACADSTESVLVNGWIVTGSKEIVKEYKDGNAFEYSLRDSFEDAGEQDPLAVRNAVMTGYFSFTENPSGLKDIFTSSSLYESVRQVWAGSDLAPLVVSVVKGKEGLEFKASLKGISVQNAEAERFAKDTSVVIPAGPFKVKNSGTGKMNEFCQNSNLSLTLREEGKDLWSIPFDSRICGRASTVDLYANGKLQIIFGAGSRIWVLDRLGRKVTGFPLDLKKEILLGPDVYDFAGKKKYNIMVLHKDNTIEMYNLQGTKPSAWKGIAVPGETIKGLPERIDLSGSTFWIVRTSVRTLVFPFYGGEPLTVLEGNQRIRPDSDIKAVDGKTVEFTCYDGKVRTQALK